MNKIIFFLLCLLCSCISRKVTLEKHEEKQTTTEQKKEVQKIDSTTKITIRKDQMLTNQYGNNSLVFVREFYENGNLKSEKIENKKELSVRTKVIRDTIYINKEITKEIKTNTKKHKVEEKNNKKKYISKEIKLLILEIAAAIGIMYLIVKSYYLNKITK